MEYSMGGQDGLADCPDFSRGPAQRPPPWRGEAGCCRCRLHPCLYSTAHKLTFRKNMQKYSKIYKNQAKNYMGIGKYMKKSIKINGIIYKTY